MVFVPRPKSRRHTQQLVAWVQTYLHHFPMCDLSDSNLPLCASISSPVK